MPWMLAMLYLVLSRYWYRTFIQTYSATSPLKSTLGNRQNFFAKLLSKSNNLCGSGSGRIFALPLLLPQKKDRFHRFQLPLPHPWLYGSMTIETNSFETTFTWDVFMWDHIYFRSHSFYAMLKWSSFDLLCNRFFWSTFHFVAGDLKFCKVTIHLKFCKVTPFRVHDNSRWVVHALAF